MSPAHFHLTKAAALLKAEAGAVARGISMVGFESTGGEEELLPSSGAGRASEVEEEEAGRCGSSRMQRRG